MVEVIGAGRTTIVDSAFVDQLHRRKASRSEEPLVESKRRKAFTAGEATKVDFYNLQSGYLSTYSLWVFKTFFSSGIGIRMISLFRKALVR
jgi:hypothetical protein